MENKAQNSGSTAIVSFNKRRWMRLPEESPPAYTALQACLNAGPGQRSIAQAYRRLKEIPEGEPVKVPGDINAWAKQYSWQEREAVWDAHIESLADIESLEQLQVSRKQTIEQSDSRLAPDENRMNPVLKVS